jgi:hypothetical protein
MTDSGEGRVCFQSDSEDDVEFDTIFNPMPAMEGLLLVFILIVGYFLIQEPHRRAFHPLIDARFNRRMLLWCVPETTKRRRR